MLSLGGCSCRMLNFLGIWFGGVDCDLMADLSF